MTQSGKVQNFKNVSAVVAGIPGFTGTRFDAFTDAGISVAWQGDAVIVVVGPGGVATYVETGNAYAIVTLNLAPSSDGIDIAFNWLVQPGTRGFSLIDANGRTFLTEASAKPRQRADMTFNATLNPLAYDIHCPNFQGPQGGLNNPG